MSAPTIPITIPVTKHAVIIILTDVNEDGTMEIDMRSVSADGLTRAQRLRAVKRSAALRTGNILFAAACGRGFTRLPSEFAESYSAKTTIFE